MKKILFSILGVLVIGGGVRIAYVEVLSPCVRLDRICARANQSGNMDHWTVCAVATLHGYRNSTDKCQEALVGIEIWTKLRDPSTDEVEKKRLKRILKGAKAEIP